MKGQRIKIKGNQPILLNDSQKVWTIASGSIALFAVAVKNGIPQGARRYLFSCESEAALFGCGTWERNQYPIPARTILAVSMEETELLLFEIEGFASSIAAGDSEAIALLKKWVGQLNNVVSSLASKLPELDISTIKNSEELLDVLSQLNNQFFQIIELLEQQEQAEEWERFQTRESFNRQVTAETMGELASLVQTSKNGTVNILTFNETISSQSEHQLLYLAARAVGQAMGIEIRPPLRSENLKRLRNPLEAIARASHIQIRRVLLEDYWWEQDCGPLLGYWREAENSEKGNRVSTTENSVRAGFVQKLSQLKEILAKPAPTNSLRETQNFSIPVALLPSGRGYILLDPVRKTHVKVNSNIQASLSSFAYMFYRPLPRKKIQALDLLAFGLKGSGKDLFAILWAGIATTLLAMWTPQATAILIDNAIPDANRGLLMQVGLGMVAAALGGAAFEVAKGFALMRIEGNADTSIQSAMWDRLLNLSVPFFRQYSTGDLRSRVSAIANLRRRLSGNTLRTLFSSSFALLNLGLLFYYSWQLALVASAIALIAIIVTTASGILTLRWVRPAQEIEGQIFGLMVQLMNGVSKLQVAGARERAFAHWGKQYNQQQRLKLKLQQIEDAIAVFNQVLPMISSIFLFGSAAFLIQTAGSAGIANPPVSTGNFLAFNAAFGIFITGATELSNAIIDILTAIPLWERLKPILAAAPEVALNKTDPGQLSGRLALVQVTFAYREDSPLVLNDVSIHVETGEFVALVGPSGSGKSTILRLLLGFETPQAGQIYYDGQDLRGLDISAVRRQLGVVTQNNRINTASIFENIAGGALISMDEAWEAAQMAGFADDIATMPMGMHTIISEGGINLSGGQRQRLTIARSLALKPRILLFDEATSSLDNKTQAIITESLNKLQVTRVAIAHRISTIRHADRIYVLQAGRVVEQGSFEELMRQQKLFFQLMARQMT